MRRSKPLRLLASLFVVFVPLVLLTQFKTHGDESGEITIVIENKEYTHEFYERNVLCLFLTKHHRTYIKGGVLYELDDIVTDFKTSYIAIYVNDEYSEKGCMLIPLFDGYVYKFVEEGVNE